MGLAAFLAALFFSVACVWLLNKAAQYPSGLLQYYCYAILFSNGLTVLFSARSYLNTGEIFTESTLSNPVAAVAIKLTSLFVMVAAGDQILRFYRIDRKFYFWRISLMLSFLLFWIFNVLVPSQFSLHPISLEVSWFYSLVLGLGLISMSNYGVLNFIKHFRNAALFFCLWGILLIPVKPDLVLQTNYSQGYIPGLPRFAGLAPHAILMGMVASLGLWCLIIDPFKSRKLNWFFILVGLFALFVSQAKNIWISFLLALPILIYFKYKLSDWLRFSSKKGRYFYIAVFSSMMIFVSLGLLLVIFGNTGNAVNNFLNSEQGSQLVTFTGREQIWAVALSEWARSPLLGYGLPLFGTEHRDAIGMFFATSGHNQIIDNLGRTGLVGTIMSTVHFLILLFLGYVYRKETFGLSFVLALSLLIRMASEVPVTLGTIAIDTLPYYLLMGLIAINMKFFKSGERIHGCENK